VINIGEPARANKDMMAIAEELVRPCPKEIKILHPLNQLLKI
jgi:hypothetical protein